MKETKESRETKYAIVVDGQGKKVDFVLIETVQVPVLDEAGKPVIDSTGTPKTEMKDVPYGYTLRDGERLIYSDISTALSMRKPRWTGTCWEEAATPEDVEATLPPLEDVRKSKLDALGAVCEAAIYAGIDVTTSKGTEHFSLTINDQTNIANLAAQAQTGATVLYHADGALCRPFAPEEMLAVAAAAVAHKTKHTTLCNHYNVWARRAETRAELEAITYGCPLPEDLAENVKNLLGMDSDDE